MGVLEMSLSKYVQLDHDLVPRDVKNINAKDEMPGRIKEDQSGIESWRRKDTFMVKKYEVKKASLRDVCLLHEQKKLNYRQEDEAKWNELEDYEHDLYKRKNRENVETGLNDKEKEKFNKPKVNVAECEAILGPTDEIYYDEDFGFFSAILACYNNHWVLHTSPDDWWSVIARIIAQAIDKNAEKEAVRGFFVEHEGKKEISIIVPKLATTNYEWLFEKFSEALKENIKNPDYVPLMQSDFSTTNTEQRISSQIMLMSSLQTYFDFKWGTMCGIPGVRMNGSKEDWQKLMEKATNLEKLVTSIIDDIEVRDWFPKVFDVLGNLLNGNPDKEWWSHILSWNKTYGSGSRNWWSGWMIDFLNMEGPETSKDFQSGTVAVPINIFENEGPQDHGLFIAGSIGFTVKQEIEGRIPEVEAKHGWALLLPKGSPITPFIKEKTKRVGM